MRFVIGKPEVKKQVKRVWLAVSEDSTEAKVHVYIDGIDVGFFDHYDSTLSIVVDNLKDAGLTIFKI